MWLGPQPLEPDFVGANPSSVPHELCDLGQATSLLWHAFFSRASGENSVYVLGDTRQAPTAVLLQEGKWRPGGGGGVAGSFPKVTLMCGGGPGGQAGGGVPATSWSRPLSGGDRVALASQVYGRVPRETRYGEPVGDSEHAGRPVLWNMPPPPSASASQGRTHPCPWPARACRSPAPLTS